MGELQSQLTQLLDCREHSFCVLDGLVCRACPKEGYTIVIPEDEELYQKLIYLHHDLPLGRHIGVFWMVKALSS